MITDSQFYALFEEIATQNKSIAHSDDRKRYFKNPEEVPEKDLEMEFYLILLPPRFQYLDQNSDNLIERFVGTFLIIKPVERESYADQLKTTTEAREIARQILSRLKKQRIEKVFNEFTIGNSQGDIIGPILENCFGVSYEFTLGDPAGIIYEPTNWFDS